MPKNRTISSLVSRRTMIGAAAATPTLTAARSLGDPAPDSLVSRCANFLAVDLRIERLTTRWGHLESVAMANHPKWWDLPEKARTALPEGSEMGEIDETLAGLFRERDALLDILPELATVDPSGLVGKLVVVTRAIRPEDEPLIHRLLADATRDLAHMHCPGCNRPLTTEDVRKFLETLS
jgi:hypothetical protein